MRSLAPLAAIHLAGNALLLWLGYYWLGLGETRAATLLWSALVALLLLSLASWLHGATFAYFAADPRRLTAAFRTSLRRLGPLVAAAIVVLAIYLLLAAWAAYSPRPAFKIASTKGPAPPSATGGSLASASTTALSTPSPARAERTCSTV